MKVYGSAFSPFTQRVLMAGRAKGHELEVAPPPGGARSAEFMGMSPLGRIPVLDHEGFRLIESGAIVGYLDDVLEGPALIPGDAKARAHVRQIESLATYELAGLRAIMIGLVFRIRKQPEIVAAAREQVHAGLCAIEQLRVPADRWAAGEAPSVADFLLIPLMTLMSLADADAETWSLACDAPALVDYYQRAAADPLAAPSVAAMTDGFPAVVERMRGRR